METSLFLDKPKPTPITIEFEDGIRHSGSLRPYSMRDDLWWASVVADGDPVEKGIKDGNVIDIIRLWYRLLDDDTKGLLRVKSGGADDAAVVDWVMDLPASQTNGIIAMALKVRMDGMPDLPPPQKKKTTLMMWAAKICRVLIFTLAGLSAFIIWEQAERIFYCVKAPAVFLGL